MKSFSYLFMAGLMTLGFWACSDDAEVTPGGDKENTADKVYMSFKLELPTASRSTTDDAGDTNSDATPDSEVGKPEENHVTRLDVVLASESNTTPPTYEYVTQANGGFDNPTATNGLYTVTFQSSTLESVAGSEIAVFVFCNYPNTTNYMEIINNSVPAEPVNLSDVYSSNSFWMSNASITKATLPIFSQLKVYNTANNPFNLGQVSVERAAARFDYKSTKSEERYTLESDGTNPIIEVQLTDMALVNMSNQFHHLRRVANVSSTPGLSDYDNATIGGKEVSSNYVIDSDAEDKISSDFLPNHFIYYWSSFDNNINDSNYGSSSVNLADLWTELPNDAKSKISDILNSTENNSEWTGETGYHIWRYAIENTLPSIAKQKKSLSTGVIFKGKLIDNADNTSKRLDGINKVYVHNNELYGSWTKVVEKVAGVQNSETDPKLIALKAAVESIQATMPTGEPEPEPSLAAENGFSVYNPIDGIYEVYYYYINRHNDNNTVETMGPMEFAVVRNNVYKLKVSSIEKYGHPGTPGGDPDPIIPTDPDETDNIYFKVDVKVLPWTVRVNNIKF